MATVKTDGNQKRLVTGKKTNPLLGLDWMKNWG